MAARSLARRLRGEAAALRIQSAWRRHVARARFLRVQRAVLAIQAAYRGLTARHVASDLRCGRLLHPPSRHNSCGCCDCQRRLQGVLCGASVGQRKLRVHVQCAALVVRSLVHCHAKAVAADLQGAQAKTSRPLSVSFCRCTSPTLGRLTSRTMHVGFLPCSMVINPRPAAVQAAARGAGAAGGVARPRGAATLLRLPLGGGHTAEPLARQMRAARAAAAPRRGAQHALATS